MKKNFAKISLLVAIVLLLSSGMVALAAAQWSSEVTAVTPNWGKEAWNNSIYVAKATNSSQGSMYATSQTTVLKHEMALTYININNEKVVGSDWVKAEVDQIKRPSLKLSTYGTAFFSVAKSASLEPTNNTVLKYKFSPDYM